ncbi:MAG TPA: hypothetical protein VGK88_07190 [bacterium]|jgi:hypothetical protein
MVRLAGYLAAFAAAIWALQAGWTQFRNTYQAPNVTGWILTAGYAALFAAAVLYLGFWLYAQDRAAGRVRKRIGLYEMFLRD